jgi:transposase
MRWGCIWHIVGSLVSVSTKKIPDHSTFSKNRHGRFRQSGVFRRAFEEIVRRCLEVGFVEGRILAVDGTLV